MVSLMAVVILVIHTSVPAYKQSSKTVLLEFNNEDVSYNIKYLDYYIHKVSKLIRLYPDDKIWSHLSQLLGEAKQIWNANMFGSSYEFITLCSLTSISQITR